MMNPKRIGKLSFGLIILLIGWVIYAARERIKIAEFRYQVFCEQLTPEMDRSDVDRVLSQYGSFEENATAFSGGLTVIGIYSTDPKTKKQFGNSIVLVFENGRYKDARVPVPFNDAYKSLCR